MTTKERLYALAFSLAIRPIKIPIMVAELFIKLAENTLDTLRKAKSESDRRNYDVKNALILSLMMQNPQDFIIDSEKHNFYGITHVPTGFKVHIPKVITPQTIKSVPNEKALVPVGN